MYHPHKHQKMSKTATDRLASLALNHTNPSMGPHETRVTISLSVDENTKARVQQFLDEATINNCMSMSDFVAACSDNNQVLFEKLDKYGPKPELKAVGGTLTHFTLSFNDGTPEIKLYDVYRDYNISKFYPDFTKYMVEHGIRLESYGFDSMEPRLIIEDLDSDISKKEVPPPPPER